MSSSVFNDFEADIDTLPDRLINKFKRCIALNFRKILISNKKRQFEPENLHEKMTKLKSDKKKKKSTKLF